MMTNIDKQVRIFVMMIPYFMFYPRPIIPKPLSASLVSTKMSCKWMINMRARTALASLFWPWAW